MLTTNANQIRINTPRCGIEAKWTTNHRLFSQDFFANGISQSEIAADRLRATLERLEQGGVMTRAMVALVVFLAADASESQAYKAEGLGRRTAELLLLRGAGELFCDLLGDALTEGEIDEAVAFLGA